MPATHSDVKRPATIHALIDALSSHGFIENSECWNHPAAIDINHPVHEAVMALERTYAGDKLPARGRSLWRQLLRRSRAGDSAVYDVVDEFIAWLEEELDSLLKEDEPEALEVQDGPLEGPGYRVRWEAKVLDVRPQTWWLLKFIWRKDHATLQQVEEDVWGNIGVAYVTLKSAIHRANKVLVRLGVPWRLSIRGGNVRKSYEV